MECSSVRPAAVPVSLLRPCCSHQKRARWRVHSAAAIQLACVLCAASGAQVARAQPPPAAAQPRLTPPEPTLSVKAGYPPEALASGKEGSATVLATVGKDGVVKSAEVGESSGDPALDQAAMSAALQWRFKPALQNGEPIESQVRIPFHFHLAEHGATEHQAAPTTPAPTPPPATPPPATPPPATPPPAAPSSEPVPGTTAPPERAYESSVRGKHGLSRGASDYHVDVEKLSLVPRANAAEFLKLAPGILLTNEGGEGHAEQIFLRGFDAREGQDLELTVDGVPINESGNLHGNGYADTHFIIPELIQSLRVLEGPLDPRQGNYAVAGSADFHLGLAERGLTGKFSVGTFGSYRMLIAYGPPNASEGTFAAAELYQTQGYGQNRDGRRASIMAQYEGHTAGGSTYRLTGQAYIASFHAAGTLRADDVAAGRVGFYDTYDKLQGEDSSRYSLAGELTTRAGRIVFTNQFFAIARPLRLRENFTGFLLDTQEPLQQPHGQRGDLLDLNMMEWTLGARGSGRITWTMFHLVQELEIGYYARGDFTSGSEQRIEAGVASNPPYLTDHNLTSNLGDIGIYGDLNLRFTRWLSLRGGIRGDLYTFDINNLCAVHSVEHPSMSNPPGDASCFSQQNFGAYRDPNQHVSTSAAAYMPRGSLVVGPLFGGFGASVSAGTGVRSIDPYLVTQDSSTPFANVSDYEGGLTYSRRFRNSIDLSLRSVLFDTKVDRELIFSQSLGRNAVCGGSNRLGSANSARLTGPFYDLAANLTYVRATFDVDGSCSDETIKQQSGALVPYVPDLVFRADSALFGELPWWLTKLRGHPLRASLAAGFTYVGPRPLPYGERSDTIFTVDSAATIGWWFATLSLGVQNLFDTRYRLGEYNYASDFTPVTHSAPFPTLVPVRQFTAGAPRTVLFSISLNYGGSR